MFPKPRIYIKYTKDIVPLGKYLIINQQQALN